MKKQYKILILDDEEQLLRDWKLILEKEKLGSIRTESNGRKAIELNKKERFDIALLDICLNQDIDGIGVLRDIRNDAPECYCIMITGHGTLDNAIKALKLGALDYLEKGILSDGDLVRAVKSSIRWLELEEENQRRGIYAQKLLKRIYRFEDLVGQSSQMVGVRKTIEQVAPTDTRVLITGKSGTGKEIVAKAIHSSSNRKNGRFVDHNCAVTPEALFESEFFGFMKGAFTGAVTNKPGLFELANRGTLFLDEVGEMPISFQAKLLRVINDGVFRRIGGTSNITVDVRIVSATNKNLEDLITKGKFREDLFYRLNVVNIYIPPLRERKEDIPDLAEHIINNLNNRFKKHFIGISKETLDVLKAYDWPGNVRELENIIERAMVLGNTPEILISDLRGLQKEKSTSSIPLSPLPQLSDTLERLKITSYLDIENEGLQENIFIRTYVECEGNLEKVRNSLDIGKGRGTVHLHFKRIQEKLLISLCRASGNIEDLAEFWEVNFIKLLNALKSKNRLHRYIERSLKEYGSIAEVARRFGVDADILQIIMKRVPRAD